MQNPKNIETVWSKYFVEEIEYGSQYSIGQKISKIPKTIYSFESRRKIRSILNESRIDICHIHNIYHHISPSILSLLKEYSIPVVMTLHDLKIACPAYTMLAQDGICERCMGGKIYNVMFRRCIKNSVALSTIVFIEAILHRMLHTYDKYVDRFVAPSQFYINKMVEWGWNRDKFVYIPNFVEVKQYQPDYNRGRGFLYFGRLTREKGLITLIKACAIAGAPLKIVGTGPDEKLLRELAHETSAGVEFLGYLHGDALHNAIRSACAVVLPSEWYENAPMSIIESYALGKPVIGAEIGGIPELIKDGKTGFTFTAGSTEELAKILGKVNLTTSKLSNMGRNGRIWVEAEFSQEKYRNRMLDLYHGLTFS